jgi:hypothetical protein
MQTFIEGVAVARKYELQIAQNLQPNESNKVPSGWVDDKSYVALQMISDSF